MASEVFRLRHSWCHPVLLVWPLPNLKTVVGLRKGFVTNMRRIDLSFATSFLSFLPRMAVRTFLGGGLVGQLVQQLVSFARLKLLSPFSFVRSRTIRSIHTAMYKRYIEWQKWQREWRGQGCGLKGGCPPCLAPGVGGTLSIKVSQVPIGIAAFDWQI